MKRLKISSIKKHKRKIEKVLGKVKSLKQEYEKRKTNPIQKDDIAKGLEKLIEYLTTKRDARVTQKEKENIAAAKEILNSLPKTDLPKTPATAPIPSSSSSSPPLSLPLRDDSWRNIDYGALSFIQKNGHGLHAACAQDVYSQPFQRKWFPPFAYVGGEETWGLWTYQDQGILAFRGTVASLDDIYNDAQIAANMQCSFDRVGSSIQLLKSIFKIYPSIKVFETTGHSLGGAIARCVAKSFNFPSVNFNPAAPPTAPVLTENPLATNYHIVFDVISAWMKNVERIDVGLRPLYGVMDTIKLVQDVEQIVSTIIDIFAALAIFVTGGLATAAAMTVIEVNHAVAKGIEIAGIASRITLGLSKIFDAHYMTRFFITTSPISTIMSAQDENDLWQDLEMHIPNIRDFLGQIPKIGPVIIIISNLIGRWVGYQGLWPPLPGTTNKSPEQIVQLFKDIHPYEHLLDGYIKPVWGYQQKQAIQVVPVNPYFP